MCNLHGIDQWIRTLVQWLQTIIYQVQGLKVTLIHYQTVFVQKEFVPKFKVAMNLLPQVF